MSFFLYDLLQCVIQVQVQVQAHEKCHLNFLSRNFRNLEKIAQLKEKYQN